MSGDDPTRADEPEPRPTPFVGRARPPEPPVPPADPYWPPLEDEALLYGPAYPPELGQRRRRSGMTPVLIVVGVFAACCVSGAVLAMFGGALFRSAVVEASAPPATSAPGRVDRPPTRADKPDAGLNDPVRDGKFEFVVKSMSCGHASVGQSYVKVEASGQFCVVSLSVKNIGDEGQTFADSFQKALGPDGTIYRAHTGAGVVANEGGEAVWNVINPGNAVTGKIVFDIPPKAEITSLEFHDSPLSGGVAVAVA